MTQNLKVAALIILAAVAAVAAGLWAGSALVSAQAIEQTAQSSTVSMHRIDAIPAPAPVADELVATTLGSEPYTTVQAMRVQDAGARVCEGFQAGVPAMVMADTLMAQEGLTDEEAHRFVIDAHRILCPLN